jgi:hypothetical protein
MLFPFNSVQHVAAEEEQFLELSNLTAGSYKFSTIFSAYN